MRLSVVFELLLIFLLIAFAASRSVGHKKTQSTAVKTSHKGTTQRQDNAINRYCNCTESICNCCRDFKVPLVNLNGPGCANLQYLPDDNLAVSLSFADRVITKQSISGRKPRPLCMPLPGGFNRFCGRIYNIGRDADDFKACLGLELQSSESIEAAVRVSCFKFGSRGVSLAPAEPLPLAAEQVEGDDDEDDEDDFDLGSVVGGDDDDDDDDDDDEDDDEDDDFGTSSEDDDDEVTEAEGSDYTGFSILEGLGGLFGESEPAKKSTKKKTTAAPQVVKPAVPATPPKKTSTKKKTTVKPFVTEKPVVAVAEVVAESVAEPVKDTVADVTTTQSAKPLDLPHSPALLELTKKPVALNEDVTLEEVPLITAPKPASDAQSETTIQDPGIQSSISYITGQLSEVPVTTIITSTQAVEEDTPKSVTPANDDENKISDDDDEDDDDDAAGFVEVVENLDDNESPSDESATHDDDSNDDDSEDDDSDDEEEDDDSEEEVSESDDKKKIKKKNSKKDDDEEDDGFLGGVGSLVGEVGEQLGLSSKKKKKKTQAVAVPTTVNKKKKGEKGDVLGLSSITSITDSLGFGSLGLSRRSNRMMRFDHQ